MFCDCKKVLPLWNNLNTFIGIKFGEDLDFSNFQQMFGIDILSSKHSMGINFSILI